MSNNVITKVYPADLEVNEGRREVLAVISTNAVDRDNEVVSPSGMKKKNFAGNPIVLVGHDWSKLPIGKALWVKSDGNRILSKYYVSDKTQEARDVFGLLQDGVLNAHSIGFLSLRSSKPTTQEINNRPELKNVRTVHREWELAEFSCVTVPSNPDALTLAVSKGCSPELINFLKGKEETETEVIEAAQEIVVKDTAKEYRDCLHELTRHLKGINVDKLVKQALGK